MKLFFPDCLWSPNQISGSSFLYFHDEPIGFGLHPSVTSHLTGVDSLTFLRFLEEKAPPWKDSFMAFFNLWLKFRQSLHATHDLVEPLREKSFKTILFSYDRGTHAWERADELLASSSLQVPEIHSLIDPLHACDELYAHLFFEKVIEERFGHLSQEALARIGNQMASASRGHEDLIKDYDWTAVYEYCSEIFTRHSLPELLTRAYMFRMPAVKDAPAILLSNPHILKFLNSLPINLPERNASKAELDADVIAWEFFRQLVSPFADPLDAKKVALVNAMLNNRRHEVERLKNKCYALAGNLANEEHLDQLTSHVRDHIKGHVSNELQQLLELDHKAFQEYLVEVFSDDKTWVALSSFVLGVIAGVEVVTAGSAICALSKLGATALKEAAKHHKRLASSSYTAIYRMRRA